MEKNPVWSALDRFVQDPFRAAAYHGTLALEEPYICDWCNRAAVPGEHLCPVCKEENRIQQMDFGKLLELLQEEAGNEYEQQIVIDGGWLLFNWLFTSNYEVEKLTRWLKARGAKHLSTERSVTFWIGVDRHGKLDFVEGNAK